LGFGESGLFFLKGGLRLGQGIKQRPQCGLVLLDGVLGTGEGTERGVKRRDSLREFLRKDAYSLKAAVFFSDSQFSAFLERGRRLERRDSCW